MCGKSALTAPIVGQHSNVVDGEDGNDAKTSLQQAAIGKHLESTERSLRVEARANACVTASGRTVLQAAEAGGYLDTIAHLVKAGAKRTTSLATS